MANKENKNIQTGASENELVNDKKTPKKQEKPEKVKPPKKEKVKPEKKEKPKPEKKKKKSMFDFKFLGGFLFSKMAKGGANELRSNATKVNNLNVFPVPDGDTGDNMRMTIESGIAAIEKIDSDNLADVMKALSHGMLLGARGNSGVILSQFFAGIAKGLEKVKKADAHTFAHALELGVEQAYASVMTPTEGTILTVAREAVEYTVSRITPKSTIKTLFRDLVKELYDAVDRTPEVLTVLKDAGVVDSGGAGLFYILDGFNRVLNGEEVKVDPMAAIDTPPPPAAPTESSFGPDSVMTYGYCTELLLQLQNSKTDIDNFDVSALKKFLASIGDSVVAFKVDSIIKLHVHTFTPEKVLEYGRQYGEFITVKIENMSVQHTELTDTAITEPEEVIEETPIKKYGVVAVSNGPGIDALFSEFGVDVIVPGGQTQNPSTNDFLDAFAKVRAEHIFVLPNNGNIIMAATQASELYETAKVHVIPSKNIGTGYVAISSIDYDNEDPNAIIDGMLAAMARVQAGYVSPSIRDADMDGVHINNGDTIGIVDKKIVLSDPDRLAATKALASMLLDSPDKYMLTVFTGADATEEETAAIKTHLEENHSDAEVYFIDGGQDIYPYIFVAE